ncbi:MAG TPA: hypothetical protein VEX17_01300 [Bacillales bacterium]|nr:hypothetical protein [Bacillales bacterium]
MVSTNRQVLEIYYHIQQSYKKALVKEHAASKDRAKSFDDCRHGKERKARLNISKIGLDH